mgnify:FL=1
MHWKESQHCYSLEVETQRVWDYVGDGYVHRLIQSKTDGKLVELNAPCRGSGECGGCDCSHESEMAEALMNSKIDGVSFLTHAKLVNDVFIKNDGSLSDRTSNSNLDFFNLWHR